MRTKTITFEGRGESGDAFCNHFFKEIESFISLTDGPRSQCLLRMLLEIVRNIYDHAEGWGYLKLSELENNCVEFEIGNLDKSESSPKCTLKHFGKKSWDNHGAGLGCDGKQGMIFTYAESIDLQLNMDIQNGYVFRGVFKK